MKILQVITGIRRAAGTSVFCGELANALVGSGCQVEVAVCAPTMKDAYPLDSAITVLNITEAISRISRGVLHPDIVHIHGLWSPPLHQMSKCARANKIPVVWSTHGMTAPWSMRHKWWKKWFAWHLYQRRDLSSAKILHVTTEQEAGWNRKLGLKNVQVVVPLGTYLPPINAHQTCRSCEYLRVLFVGRIYPVKGLMNVVHAAALLKDVHVRFRVVGPDQAGHKAELLKEAARLGVSELFEWAGPKYGEELRKEYEECDMLILPSFTENFGAVVVDALAHGKPVLASRFTPWKVLSEEKCGWWVSNDPHSLASTLSDIQLLDVSELSDMGNKGRKLIKQSYVWDVVCDSMKSAYKQLEKI